MEGKGGNAPGSEPLVQVRKMEAWLTLSEAEETAKTMKAFRDKQYAAQAQREREAAAKRKAKREADKAAKAARESEQRA